MKPCSKCGVPKELSDFNKREISKDGCTSECKLCKSKQNKKWRKSNKELISEQKKKYRESSKDRHAERAKKYYEINKDKKKEYYESNKDYINERKKKWRESNKDHVAEQHKKWRESNKEYVAEQLKKWRRSNPEQCTKLKKEWRKANPSKVLYQGSKRRSIKLQAYPPWAATLEKRQIEEIYTLARIQSEATGKKYHVDHIHPLQAPKKVMFEGEMIPLICGLHVLANLQILKASVNCSKQNKFEPYIESECDFTESWQVRSNDRTLIPTPIDRVSTHNPNAPIVKPKKTKALTKGQLALF